MFIIHIHPVTTESRGGGVCAAFIQPRQRGGGFTLDYKTKPVLVLLWRSLYHSRINLQKSCDSCVISAVRMRRMESRWRHIGSCSVCVCERSHVSARNAFAVCYSRRHVGRGSSVIWLLSLPLAPSPLPLLLSHCSCFLSLSQLCDAFLRMMMVKKHLLLWVETTCLFPPNHPTAAAAKQFISELTEWKLSIIIVEIK